MGVVTIEHLGCNEWHDISVDGTLQYAPTGQLQQAQVIVTAPGFLTDAPGPADPALLVIPEQALIFNAAGTQAAVLDPMNRVHLRTVTLGENLGQAVQVISGLSPSDRVVNNPPAGLLEDQEVRPVAPVQNAAVAVVMQPRSAGAP